MKITNNGNKPVTMPGGRVLQPGESQIHALAPKEKSVLEANSNLELETAKKKKAKRGE